MERDLQAMIGNRLRARYAEILAEPIPDKFLDLINRLDQPAGAADAPGRGDDGSRPREDRA
jgi:hypothetical protein